MAVVLVRSQKVSLSPPQLAHFKHVVKVRLRLRHQRRTDASPTTKAGEMEIKVSSLHFVFCLEL